MATYKTKNGQLTGFVPGVGEIVDGLIHNAPEGLESANLVRVEEEPAKAAPVAPAPAAAPVPAPTPTAPITTTEENN
jgi:hypothetical protein